MRRMVGRQNSEIENPNFSSMARRTMHTFTWGKLAIESECIAVVPGLIKFSFVYTLLWQRKREALVILWMHVVRTLLQWNRTCLNNSLKYYLFGRMLRVPSSPARANVRIAAFTMRFHIRENIYFRFTNRHNKNKKRAKKNPLCSDASGAVS